MGRPRIAVFPTKGCPRGPERQADRMEQPVEWFGFADRQEPPNPANQEREAQLDCSRCPCQRSCLDSDVDHKQGTRPGCALFGWSGNCQTSERHDRKG